MKTALLAAATFIFMMGLMLLFGAGEEHHNSKREQVIDDCAKSVSALIVLKGYPMSEAQRLTRECMQQNGY